MASGTEMPTHRTHRLLRLTTLLPLSLDVRGCVHHMWLICSPPSLDSKLSLFSLLGAGTYGIGDVILPSFPRDVGWASASPGPF